jgi:hypothetical protein
MECIASLSLLYSKYNPAAEKTGTQNKRYAVQYSTLEGPRGYHSISNLVQAEGRIGDRSETPALRFDDHQSSSSSFC